jgi:hypothetical protein
MQRGSIAIFLTAAGLLAGTVGCGKAPEPRDSNAPAMERSAPGSAEYNKDHKDNNSDKKEKSDKHDSDKSGEGGEGGDGGEG